MMLPTPFEFVVMPKLALLEELLVVHFFMVDSVTQERKKIECRNFYILKKKFEFFGISFVSVFGMDGG